MVDKGSVAPKERVNITYKAAIGDATEEKELPFKTFVMADFTGRPEKTPLEQRKVIDINGQNFNDVLGGMGLSMEMHVDNKLTAPAEGEEDAGSIPVSLSFKMMKDFEPESIARQVPEIKDLLGLRDALVALKGPLGNYPDFRKRLQALLSDEEKAKQVLSELGAAEG